MPKKKPIKRDKDSAIILPIELTWSEAVTIYEAVTRLLPENDRGRKSIENKISDFHLRFNEIERSANGRSTR